MDLENAEAQAIWPYRRPTTTCQGCHGTTSSADTTSAGCTTGIAAFNLETLRSPLFKIVIQDGEEAIYYIHKELLASLSPELRSHTNNEMWEGLHDEMRLRDVNGRTMKRFLQWAYFQDYTVEETGALEATLQTHLELYVFGDRFNVKSLRELSLRKLQSVFEEQQSRVKRSYYTGSSLQFMRSQLTPTIPEVVNAARLAIESLPNLRDSMLQSLLGYLSWAMSWAEDLPDLIELIQENTDVEIALMRYPPSVAEPPWAKKGMGGQRERRLLCKCDACGRLRILARVDCGSCGKSIQADPCGWFDRTSISQIGKAGSACSSCGKTLINRCTPCKETYLAIQQSRRIYDAMNDQPDDDYLDTLQDDAPWDEDDLYCDELADIDGDITSELDADLWDDHLLDDHLLDDHTLDYDSEY